MKIKQEQQNIDKENGNFLYTFDLGAAALLVTAGFELIGLDRTNTRKVQFIFNRTKDIEKVVDGYWTNKLQVEARSFFDNIKMLKNRIYSE
ncbi:MAG: DUF5659 domain-containing protein [Candidatus Paceibacterota bacterium]|jgi:hypothetical protein